MAARPIAPYPDGTPDEWAKEILEQGIRGIGSISHVSNGDFCFHSGTWQTVHGPATAARADEGAFMVWGALLSDGRRVHCRRSRRGTIDGVWRRRSDDGRSWVVGQIFFEPSDVSFTDGSSFRPPVELDPNVFERAMASQPAFIRELQDDSLAFTLNRDLWVEALCTLDGAAGWNPSRGEAADTIARLRGFGETYADFKFGGPHPEPPRTDRTLVLEALAAAGWRYQTDEEYRRLSEKKGGSGGGT